MYDLIIIGASAAGAAASIYAARRRLNFLVVSADIGGEVATSGEIENWPGIVHTTGIELADMFKKHMEANEVKIDEGFLVTKIETAGNAGVIKGAYHIVHAEKGAEKKTYKTKTIIIASGIHPRHLGVPGEKELYGKGVTYCTVCDGPLYKNRATVTIGGGNSALESTLMMSDIAKKVYVLNINPAFKGEQILIDKLSKKQNVQIIFEARTKAILGKEKVEGVLYEKNGKEERIAADGVMVHIGMAPNSGFIDSVKKNNFNEIEVDLTGKTGVPGIFAAGDVTNIPYKQIVVAAGQGTAAALSAIDYINRW